MSPSLGEPTPVSLLERLCRGADADAWRRFVRLYTPLLFRWARGRGLDRDADDCVQETFALLLRQFPRFRYEPGGGFRKWLRVVFRNVCETVRRRQQRQELTVDARALADAPADDADDEWIEAEYRQYVIGRAWELVQIEFNETTQQAFWAYTIQGHPAAEVASKLGITLNAVHQARSRVLSRLRDELAGLID